MRIAARDSRRLEAVAHSPVYAHFSDSLRGMPTVRAYGAGGRFVRTNLALIEAMALGNYANNGESERTTVLHERVARCLVLCGRACE